MHAPSNKFFLNWGVDVRRLKDADSTVTMFETAHPCPTHGQLSQISTKDCDSSATSVKPVSPKPGFRNMLWDLSVTRAAESHEISELDDEHSETAEPIREIKLVSE